ncbi:MAG: type II secretion system F family protein [Candidatus Moraniibacteriota bacterium]
MKFLFKAKDQQGLVVEGKVNSINEELAVQILQRNNLIPISIEHDTSDDSVVSQGGFLDSFQHLWEGVSLKEKSLFFRQLGALINAHVPILNALHTVGDQLENLYFRRVIRDVANNVEDGMSLSESMESYSQVFTKLEVSMIRAGEISGNLRRSISLLADNLEKQYVLNSQIRSAMIYPAFVLSVGAIVGFIVISFILPKITVIIKETGAVVPWYTKVVMGIGDFMNLYWWVVFLGVVAFILSVLYYSNTEDGKKDFGHLILNLPVMGSLMRKLYIARFADNMGALLGSGIPMVRSLTTVADVIGNDRYKSIIDEVGREVQAGGSMSTAFARYPEHIPGIVVQMIQVGEETGEMEQILKNTSEFYTQETDVMAKNMVALIEPIMIIFLAVGVAILVFSVILPIYNVVGQIQ